MACTTIPPIAVPFVYDVDVSRADNRKAFESRLKKAGRKAFLACYPKPYKRPGPKLLNPLRVFIEIEKVLQSYDAEELWNNVTVNWITLTVQKNLKNQQVTTSRALHPYVHWFLQVIMVWEDLPPRVRYKVHTVEDREHWYSADVARLNATRRLAAFPRHPRCVLGFTRKRWTQLTMEQRADLLEKAFLRKQRPLLQSYHSPLLNAALTLATGFWLTGKGTRQDLLNQWEELVDPPTFTLKPKNTVLV